MGQSATQGQQVGNYLGQPIFKTITSRNGTYVFDRIAKNIDGEFPLDQLGKDEVLIKPGLIYRYEIQPSDTVPVVKASAGRQVCN